MIVYKGANSFHPLKPIWIFGKDRLVYKFKINDEWFIDDLTEPDHYGLKLPAVGRFNYHNKGANWAIIHEQGKCYVYPRYYLNGLHELNYLKREIYPNIWYEITTEFKSLAFYFENEMLYSSEIIIPAMWITPSYLGRKKVGVAKRNLSLEICKK